MTDPIHGSGDDPVLGEALHRAGGDPPFDEVDWEGLRGRIAAGAELPLARLRRHAAVAEIPPRVVHSASAPVRTARWRRAAGVAAAACVGAVALAGTLRVLPGDPSDTGAPLPPREAMVVEEIVSASLPDGLPALMSGEAAEEALLEAALDS